MLPWGHLAFGYLLYAAYCHFAAGHRPRGGPAILLALGTQFPDLIDKPMAYAAGVLPSGRSLAHSLPLAAVALSLAYAAAVRRYARPVAFAFGFGYLSHLFADVLYPLLRLNFRDAGFVLWPLIEPAEVTAGTDFVAYLASHLLVREMTPEFAFEALLVVAALVAWRADGYPGLATLRSWSLRAAGRVTDY